MTLILPEKSTRDFVLATLKAKTCSEILNHCKFPPKRDRLPNLYRAKPVADFFGITEERLLSIATKNRKEFCADDLVFLVGQLQDDLFKTREGRDLVMSESFEDRVEYLSHRSVGEFFPTSSVHKVYFILDTVAKAIKIGFSRNVEQRFNAFQVGNLNPLRLLAVQEGGRAKELELHRRFSAHKLRSEWFKDCKEIREYIGSLPPYDPSKQFKGLDWHSMAIVRLALLLPMEHEPANEVQWNAVNITQELAKISTK